jgi:hypothetical protein
MNKDEDASSMLTLTSDAVDKIISIGGTVGSGGGAGKGLGGGLRLARGGVPNESSDCESRIPSSKIANVVIAGCSPLRRMPFGFRFSSGLRMSRVSVI